MPGLAHAVREERWDLVAMLLLKALLETAQRLPEDAIPQLIRALEGEQDADPE
ncbi:MAG: hypothetical protein IIB33_05880 [Chloroflexi bacterium]|nr:hypothetical protein [Chloroflexota bacterium]